METRKIEKSVVESIKLDAIMELIVHFEDIMSEVPDGMLKTMCKAMFSRALAEMECVGYGK